MLFKRIFELIIASVSNPLKSISFDELSGLWSGLKSALSLVGPRPLLLEYLPLYSTAQTCRYVVKLDIVGWAQINGDNNISGQGNSVFSSQYQPEGEVTMSNLQVTYEH